MPVLLDWCGAPPLLCNTHTVTKGMWGINIDENHGDIRNKSHALRSMCGSDLGIYRKSRKVRQKPRLASCGYTTVSNAGTEQFDYRDTQTPTKLYRRVYMLLWTPRAREHYYTMPTCEPFFSKWDIIPEKFCFALSGEWCCRYFSNSFSTSLRRCVDTPKRPGRGACGCV